jgi:hypothetical protein
MYHMTIITAYHAYKLPDSILFFANGNLVATIFHYFCQCRSNQRMVAGREAENKREKGTKLVPGRNEVGTILSLKQDKRTFNKNKDSYETTNLGKW